jgi:hypothetical protein
MYAEGRFEKGVQFFECCLSVNPASPVTPYAHYAVALGYLVGMRGVSPVWLQRKIGCRFTESKLKRVR